MCSLPVGDGVKPLLGGNLASRDDVCATSGTSLIFATNREFNSGGFGNADTLKDSSGKGFSDGVSGHAAVLQKVYVSVVDVQTIIPRHDAVKKIYLK